MAKVKRKTERTKVYKVTLSEDEATALASLLYLTCTGSPLDSLYMELLYGDEDETLYHDVNDVIESGNAWRWDSPSGLLIHD